MAAFRRSSTLPLSAYSATWAEEPAVCRKALGTIQSVSAQILDKLEGKDPQVSEGVSSPSIYWLWSGHS